MKSLAYVFAALLTVALVAPASAGVMHHHHHHYHHHHHVIPSLTRLAPSPGPFSLCCSLHNCSEHRAWCPLT